MQIQYKYVWVLDCLKIATYIFNISSVVFIKITVSKLPCFMSNGNVVHSNFTVFFTVVSFLFYSKR